MIYNSQHSYVKFRDINNFKEISLNSMHKRLQNFHKKFAGKDMPVPVSKESMNKSISKNVFPILWEASQKFTRKHLCWSFFLDKVTRYRSATSCKTRLHHRFFLWILQNLLDYFFCRGLPDHCSDYSSINSSEGGTGKRNCTNLSQKCKLSNRPVQTKEQV